MEQKILVLSGKKGSGKNTSANYLIGYHLLLNGITNNAEVDELGQLWIQSEYEEDGQIISGMGVLDPERKDRDFFLWAQNEMYPYVKNYSFAQFLKTSCIRLFGLTYNQCYGSNDDKNSPTELKWSSFYLFLDAKFKKELKKSNKLDEFMTAREVLQYYGSSVVRKINPNAWADAVKRKILEEQIPFCIVTDCRFSNEIESIQSIGGKVIRFLRNPYDDKHESETALDKYPENKFDWILDNSNQSIEEQNDSVIEKLNQWGWL